MLIMTQNKSQYDWRTEGCHTRRSRKIWRLPVMPADSVLLLSRIAIDHWALVYDWNLKYVFASLYSIFISLGPMPPYGRRTYTVGAYIWGVLNVLLRASGTQLGLDLTCFSSVICHPSSVLRCLSSASQGGSKWLEVMIFQHWREIPTDWKWWFFVTDGGSQLTF